MLRYPRTTEESFSQQLENIAALFPDGVHKASNAHETPRALKRAGAPRDLLEKAYHTKRPFRQIVREGNFRPLDEQKHFLLVLDEALVKVGRLGFLPPASRTFLSRLRRRKLDLPGDQNRAVPLPEGVYLGAGENSVRSRVLGLVHLHEQIEHLPLFGPSGCRMHEAAVSAETLFADFPQYLQ